MGDASCLPHCPGYHSIPRAVERDFCRRKDGVAVLENVTMLWAMGQGLFNE